MTLQMALLEERIEGEQYGFAQGIEQGRNEERELLALKLLRRGRPLQEIQEDTGLPFQRLQQLAGDHSDK